MQLASNRFHRNKYSVQQACSTFNLTEGKMMKNYYYLRSNQMHKVGVVVAAAIFMAGCASTSPSMPAPTEQMAVSRAALNNASSTGGNEFAPIQYRSAMEKMEAAERAMGEKNYARARLLAEEAQVDADLAVSAARSAKAQKAADAVQEDNRVLRKEIDRKTK
ncbi:MAG: DUF4398 domain-containing protein [Gallionella sp.]|nr:DUF4398 domain-containing protein [Gallionella sp.]